MGLFFITPGRIRAPEFMLLTDVLSLRQRLIPTTIAVLERPNGDVVLVDAGFSRAEMEAPRKHLGLLHGTLTQFVGTPDHCAATQLMSRGIAPSRVTTIIATHMHLDHIGGYVDFPNAEVVAPAAEFSSAKLRGSMAGYIHTDAILQSGRARPLMFAGDRHRGFPRHADLFDDGCVILLDAKGHTAGSCAVLLTDSDGASVLMAGDTAYTGAEYRLARFSRLMISVGWDRDWIRATWGALADFELNNPEIPVVCSHDEEAFVGVCERHA
jgi:N-acyl homoserine lactone hydrolase